MGQHRLIAFEFFDNRAP